MDVLRVCRDFGALGIETNTMEMVPKIVRTCPEESKQLNLLIGVEKWLPDVMDGFSNRTDVLSMTMDMCSSVDAKMCASKPKNIRRGQNELKMQNSPDTPKIQMAKGAGMEESGCW